LDFTFLHLHLVQSYQPLQLQSPWPLLQDDISEEIMSDYSLVLYFFIYFVLKFMFYQANFMLKCTSNALVQIRQLSMQFEFFCSH
jgi:hypothetical protein